MISNFFQSKVEDDLKHALAFTRVRCKIEFWEGMLAPNLLLKADTSLSSADTDEEKKSDQKSERRKKKEGGNAALKKIPTEVFERISQHSKTWYWILTSNPNDKTVQQLLRNLEEGHPKVDIVEFSKRMAGFFTVTSGPSHIVSKQYRKIKLTEVDEIIEELGVEEPITVKCLKALLKLG